MSQHAITQATTLLRESRGHHAAYQQAQRRQNYVEAEIAVAEALRTRLEAAEADPDRESPEWRNDKAPHAEMVAFYQKYPSIP